MAEILLQATDIVAGYVKDLPILRDVSLNVEKGSLTLIIGPNGAGKSTFIKAIAGVVSVSSGAITLSGRDICGIRPDQMAQHGIAYVPQSDNIFRTLTIRQNLELVLRNAGLNGPAKMSELFLQFPPLADKQNQKAGALSGGQRQMLAVAMALAVDPSLILMDEPSAGLSPKVAEEVLQLARDLTRTGVSILLVEQNVKQAMRVADHCYILAEGRYQHDASAAELLNDPVVGEIYLGGKRVEAT
jgi:ABC-type branched-subunit amino acid transport system ATPase component